MNRALCIKEWTQLAGLRWVGLGLGLGLPLVAFAGAEAGRRGWMPVGRISGYSAQEVLLLGLPPLFIGLWGLLSLLIAGQTFAADRADGTESFLLERPVPRRAVWNARLLAGGFSLLAILLAHLLLWLGLVELVGYGDRMIWVEALRNLTVYGGLIALHGFLGGLAASAFVGTPIRVVLFGLVLGTLPAVLASLLVALFPLAAIHGLPIGFLLPLLLLAGFVVTAFRAACRGEPAGRGRLRRSFIALGLFLGAVPLTFALAAPLSLRWMSGQPEGPMLVVSSRDGRIATVLGSSWMMGIRLESGWIVDLSSNRRVDFLPPPIHDVAWNDDGTKLAVIHSARALGGMTAHTTLDLLDASGTRLADPIRFNMDEFPITDLTWFGDRLLGRYYGGYGGADHGIAIITPSSGRIERVPLAVYSWWWHLMGPTDDGVVYVHGLVDPRLRRFALHRLDTTRARLDADPVLVEEGTLIQSHRALSPSGRYFLLERFEDDPPEPGDQGRFEWVELGATGGGALPGVTNAVWVPGDRLACVESRDGEIWLTLGHPGATPERLRALPDGHTLLHLSPDGRRLLVQVWKRHVGPEFVSSPAPLDDLQLLGIHDLETGEWSDSLHALDLASVAVSARLAWAGPRKLALTGDGVVALADLESDRVEFLFGGPPH